MKQAEKFKDLFNRKNLFRYWKKFFVFGLLYTIISPILTLTTLIFGVNITNTDTIQSSIQTGGIKAMIIILIAVILQMIIGGFLLEYINNTKNKAIKWVKN